MFLPVRDNQTRSETRTRAHESHSVYRRPQTRKHCCGNIVVSPNVPRLRGQATFVAETFFASEKQKMFQNFLRIILFLQQCFPVCAARKQCFRNSVSATMFPRLRGPVFLVHVRLFCFSLIYLVNCP